MLHMWTALKSLSWVYRKAPVVDNPGYSARNASHPGFKEGVVRGLQPAAQVAERMLPVTGKKQNTVVIGGVGVWAELQEHQARMRTEMAQVATQAASVAGAPAEAAAAPAPAGRASPAVQVPGSAQSGGADGGPQLEGSAAAGQKRKGTPAASDGVGEPRAQRPRQGSPAGGSAQAASDEP